MATRPPAMPKPSMLASTFGLAGKMDRLTIPVEYSTVANVGQGAKMLVTEWFIQNIIPERKLN